MTELVLLATGWDADVFALDTQRVLRRYRGEGDVAAEASVMAHVGGLGFPLPWVYSASGGDLVLERLTGPTMLQALRAGEITAVAAAELLAGLLAQLHALPPQMPEKPGERPVHLDLHPANVMLEARGPVVIDWRNSGQGQPEFDVAVSALIVAQAAVDSAREEAALAATFLTAFLASVDAVSSEALEQAVWFRRADPNLATREIALLAMRFR
ncbi:phosphotransferase [Streptomyces sp. NPDC050997]|uniref:phosphotransferase n=1 Tax=Streptomyces sp. NPDC050997 TaxID=3155519 RepID=UPI00343D7338